MFRGLYYFLLLLSALLCGAFIAMWARSQYGIVDQLEFYYDGGFWRSASVPGRLVIDNQPLRDLEQQREQVTRERFRPALEAARQQERDALQKLKQESSSDHEIAVWEAAFSNAQQVRKAYRAAQIPVSLPETRAAIPHVAAVAATALLPAAWFLGACLRLRRRRSNGMSRTRESQWNADAPAASPEGLVQIRSRWWRSLTAGGAILSLALSIAAGVLWYRSYRSPDEHRFADDRGRWRMASSRGQLLIDNQPQLQYEKQIRLDRYQTYRSDNARMDAAIRKIDRDEWRPDMTRKELDQLDKKREQLRNENKRLFDNWLSRFSASTDEHTGFALPHGWVVAAFALLPTAWLLKLLAAARGRRRQRLKGCCIKCGYDLRASPERCPECGTMAAMHVPNEMSATVRAAD